MQIAEKLDLDLKNDKDKLDNLIIPQYYYNARGRKEYTQFEDYGPFSSTCPALGKHRSV